MNYRCSWPERPMSIGMASFTCPHRVDHSTLPTGQIQNSAPAHTHCTFCTSIRSYTTDEKITRFFSESTRGAFSSIEAVLTAVNSVTDVLNVTHHAVFSFFQAVIGALDEFAKLKTQIHYLLASTALLNWLRYIWRLLLKCLRLRNSSDGEMEEIWIKVQKNSSTIVFIDCKIYLLPMILNDCIKENNRFFQNGLFKYFKHSVLEQIYTGFSNILNCRSYKTFYSLSCEIAIRINSDVLSKQETPSQLVSSNLFCWLPSLMFWLISISVPYLMYQSIGRNMDESVKWTTRQDGYYEALATENHDAEGSDKMSFKCGDVLLIAPREYQPQKLGYILAYSRDSKKVGLVPIKKIRLMKRVFESSVSNKHDTVQLFDDAHASENDLYD